MIAEQLEALKAACPSWKATVSLCRTCYEPWRQWEVSVSDVWSHINLPTFIAATPEKALTAAKAYLDRFVEDGYDDDMVWLTDDGDLNGDTDRYGVSYLGEIYLDLPVEEERS